jgi:hypothetical protein
VEVLRVSVSKLARDSFGYSVGPFSNFNPRDTEPGTVLLAKFTPHGPTAWDVQPDRCRLVSFTDDIGTDLTTNAAPSTQARFFSRNRPLEELTAREQGQYGGVRVRSYRVPAPTANRLNADVLLVFRPGDAERTEQRADVPLQTNDVVTVGPVQVKFSVRSPSPYAPTNRPGIPAQTRQWTASFLPSSEIAVASVAFFSPKSDEPILVVRNVSPEGTASSSNTGIYGGGPRSGAEGDPFYRQPGYGFTPPEDGKITIKLRYCDAKSLVEKHCLISTGLSP